MKKMVKLMAGALCAVLAGTVAAEDTIEPVWLLITPDVAMRPNKYGDDVPEITGYSTNKYAQVDFAVRDAKPGSTILLSSDCSFPQSPISINANKIVTIDLNGHSLSPWRSQGGWPIVFKGPATNAVLSISNGILSNDVQFITQDTTGTGSVVLGPDLVSDGNIDACIGVNATNRVQVILESGFKSTRTEAFDTEAQFLAMQGAKFAYPHNSDDETKPGRLRFPSPDLQLVPRDDGTYVVGVPMPDQIWDFDLAHWMDDIPTNTPLYKICLPAAHDAGMSGDNLASGGIALDRILFISQKMFETQRLDIKGQLEAGSRLFDLRFRKTLTGNKFRTYHSSSPDAVGMYGEEMTSIFNSTYNFLKNHPGEFVIFELSHPGRRNGLLGNITEAETQQAVIDVLLKDHPLKELLFKLDPDKIGDDKSKWPMINDMTLGDVRGKLIVLVEPHKGTDPVDPRKGIWGFRSGASERYLMLPGYYGVFDDYANRDTVKAVKNYYIDGWTNDDGVFVDGAWHQHTKKRIGAEKEGKKTTAFCLSWTLTFNPKEYSIVKNWKFWLFVAFFIGGLVLPWFMGPAGLLLMVPLFIYWRFGAFGHGVDDMAAEINPQFMPTMNKCLSEIDASSNTNKFLKPSVVFCDFADPKINRDIISLNSDLCKYAAEVVRPDGTVDRKYENLNDAFTNELLHVANNKCTVRLLRTEAPGDENGFVVQEGYHVRFDLNGKRLQCGVGAFAKSKNPLLTNMGHLEVFNSKPDAGGFGGERPPVFSVLLKPGFAIKNDAQGDLILKGVKFIDVKYNGMLSSDESIIDNSGRTVVLDDVTISSKCSSAYAITQSSGGTYLTNCMVSASIRKSPICGSGGSIEMFGGCIDSGGAGMSELSGRCVFTLRNGEIKGSDRGGFTKHPFQVKGNATLEIYDGFVGAVGESNFTVESGAAASVHGGCFAKKVPKQYIADGKICIETQKFMDYPYEIVTGQDDKPEVARIVETGDKYPTVQAAVEAVKAAGVRQTVELLCNTHPTDTITIDGKTALTLDLQGCDLVKRGTEKPAICNYGGLTLTDTSTNGWGSVSAFAAKSPVASERGGIIYNAGTLFVEAGEIRDGLAVKGGGIYNETNGLCLVESGMFADCRATESGGGVFNCGRLVLRGGQIATCTADKSGGGIWNAGDLKVLDGAIRACTSPVGGGLANGRNAALFGGVIADNVSTEGIGAGIYADRQTETMVCGAWVKDLIAVSSILSGTARVRIFEGYFGESPRAAWLDEGSALTLNGGVMTRADYPYLVLPKAVAEVDGKPYKTLYEALQQTINAEKTVRLLSHIRNTDTVLPASCNAVLDLAGHWILGCDAALTLQTDSRLRIVDSVGGGTVNCLFATNSARACSIRNAGICRIEGGRYADAIDNSGSLSIKMGLFGQDPHEWVDSRSSTEPNEDDLTRYEYPFAVVAKDNAARAEEPTNLLPLQEALDGDDLTGESLRTIYLAEDSDFVSVTVHEGHRAVLDLRGRRLHGVAHRPVITVERGAVLTIVDSVGGGLILKEDVNRTDPELVGGIVNYGDLTLAGGTISNCCGRIYGGVYNAPGATFWMSGGGIAGCGTTATDNESAPGVLNAGRFWMSGGEITDCRSAGGVMAVCNLTGAEFNQLGGTIADGFNGAGEAVDRSHVCYVWNEGRYALVDGRVLESNDRQTGYWRECICNALDGSFPDGSFVQLWGTVVAPAGHSRDNAISYLGRQDDPRIFRISNGMIDGQVEWVHPGDAVFTGAVSGGFFTTNLFLRTKIDSRLCICETNTDAATKQEYAWRVVPKYEAEVLDSTDTVVKRCTLQEGLDYRNDQGVRLRLVTDVKDCVVCSNAAPVMLDLNGFAISGTGKIFADGFARSVIRNEGALTVYDSRSDRTGIIAMPSDGTAEEGGAICNHGTLCVSNVVIFGTRARRGGGVFNAIDATADLVKVDITGCQATEATSGDLICNEGALALTDCTLEAWPDAHNPKDVRRGLAIAAWKTSQTKIVNCKVRGQITAEELDGGSVPVAIESGLFDDEPTRDWIVEPSVCQRNGNEETRYTYRWSVDRGLSVRVSSHGSMDGGMGMDALYVRFGDGDFELVSRKTETGTWMPQWRTFNNVARDAKMTLRASFNSAGAAPRNIEKTISMTAFPCDNDYVRVLASVDLFFDAKIDDALFVTVSDALAAANGRVVTLFHDVDGDGHRLPAGKRAVLDLNGYVLRGDGTNSVIVNEGELTLRDSSTSGIGQVVRSGDRIPQSGGGVCNLGVFTLESGVIAGCRAVNSGGGIYGSDRSVTYIRGGEIFGCWAENGPSIYSFGRVEVSGGAICERMAFGKLPPNPDDPSSAWRGASVFITGGIFGTYPQPSGLDDSWLVSGSEVVPNDDAVTKVFYPYKVVDTLAGEPIYDVIRVNQSYFSGFYPKNPTVLQAGRIYRFFTNVTLVGSTTDPTLASALSVTGGTTVIYIDKGVTVALTGSVARVDGVAYPGAGLRVPEHATLIVTGEGTLIAKGADSVHGEDGDDAEDHSGARVTPGNGGHGGSGAAAAIGGVGGIGGEGEIDFGYGPNPAEAGAPGEGMGRVIFLGNVQVSASSCSTAAAGGKNGKGDYDFYHNYAGGGGGGGSGGIPIYAIGGGAGGGGGGSLGESNSNTAGAGGFGGSFAGNDGEGEDGGDEPGAGGACGEDGEFYVGDLVSLDCEYLDGGTNRTGRTLNRHDALRRRITVKTESGFELGSFEAYVGEPLPEINPDIIKAWGKCSGLYCYRIIADFDEKWYEADGTPSKSLCEVDYLGDVTLYLRLKEEKTVAIIEDETLGTLRFETLADAVAAAKYGSTIKIIGDVRGENVKVPIGITILVEPPNGSFRPPEDVDLRHKYYRVTTNYVAGKPCYTYGLNEEMVIPKFGASDGTPVMEFVRDDEGKVMSVKLNVENVYEDLYYILYWGLSPLPEEMVPVTWECADGDGTIRLEAPADENSSFYRIRVTDHIEGLLW